MHTPCIRNFSLLVIAITAAINFNPANASGFQIRDNSIKNLGRANAGTAVAREDTSVVSNNPAAMLNIESITFQVDAAAVNFSTEFTPFRFDNALNTFIGGATGGGGFNIRGVNFPFRAQNQISGGNGGNPGGAAVIPSISAVFPLEFFSLGASISSPFGLSTEYDADWVGRYNAVTSELATTDLTLSIAFSIFKGLSFGLGFIYERASATLTNALDYGTQLCAANADACQDSGQQDGFFSANGNDSKTGWIAGAQWQLNEQFVLGYSYRTDIKHTLTGTAEITVPNAISGDLQQLADNRRLDLPLVGGVAYVPLTLPVITTLSAHWM